MLPFEMNESNLEPKILKCIFPILSVKKGETHSEVGICGTGFIIGNNGLFMTAAHVFNRKPKGTKFYYYDSEINGWENQLELTVIYENCENEILIGKMNKTFTNKLQFNTRPSLILEPIILTGFPECSIVGKDGTFDTSSLKFKAITSSVLYSNVVFTDEDRNHYSCNVKFDAILATDKSINGMSGGPVLDNTGKLQGLISGNADDYGKNVAAIVRKDFILPIFDTYINEE